MKTHETQPRYSTKRNKHRNAGIDIVCHNTLNVCNLRWRGVFNGAILMRGLRFLFSLFCFRPGLLLSAADRSSLIWELWTRRSEQTSSEATGAKLEGFLRRDSDSFSRELLSVAMGRERICNAKVFGRRKILNRGMKTNPGVRAMQMGRDVLNQFYCSHSTILVWLG